MGILMVVAALLIFAALFSKDRIATYLSGGETIKVNFAQDYKLRPFVSKVKVGFVPVGRVSAVERAEDGSAIVSLKVEDDVLDTLGSEPTATIRPTTVLGGSYFVDLQKGGDAGAFGGDTIPVERTVLPVELDKVVRALQPDALAGMQRTLGRLDATLGPEGRRALARLMEQAPTALRPTGRVLAAMQGTDPHHDLTGLVRGFETTGRVLTERDGQLDRILANLTTTTGVLARRSGDLGTALDRLPSALDSAQVGLRDLDGTLQTLTEVSEQTRPIAVELGETLQAIGPVLAEARPVMADLRDVARDARPMLTAFVPSARAARGVIADVRGPVIERVNGPVMDWLYEPYQGTGPYARTSSKKTMYEEITYAMANVARASSMVDPNGHAIAFQPGVGAGSVGGLPISVEQYFNLMGSWIYGTKVEGTTASNLTSDNLVGSVNGLLAALLGGS